VCYRAAGLVLAAGNTAAHGRKELPLFCYCAFYLLFHLPHHFFASCWRAVPCCVKRERNAAWQARRHSGKWKVCRAARQIGGRHFSAGLAFSPSLISPVAYQPASCRCLAKQYLPSLTNNITLIQQSVSHRSLLYGAGRAACGCDMLPRSMEGRRSGEKSEEGRAAGGVAAGETLACSLATRQAVLQQEEGES